MAGWLVGLVLGLRTFSPQGLFVVGGALTDRYGPRPVVLTGCVLRIAGFGWLALAGCTATVIGAVLLIGFAAALFSPAVESETAREAAAPTKTATGPHPPMYWPLFSAAGQAGAFLGPLLGCLLLLLGGGLPHGMPRRSRRLRRRTRRTRQAHAPPPLPPPDRPYRRRPAPSRSSPTGPFSSSASCTAAISSPTTSSTSPCPPRWSAPPAPRAPSAGSSRSPPCSSSSPSCR